MIKHLTSQHIGQLIDMISDIDKLTPQQINQLIDMISMIHGNSDKVVQILKDLNGSHACYPSPDELETLITWSTQTGNNYWVAKKFTYVVLKNLGCQKLIEKMKIEP